MCLHVNLGLNMKFVPLWRSEQPLKGHGHKIFSNNPHIIVCACPRRFEMAFKTMSHMFTWESLLKQAISATLEVKTASKGSWTSTFLQQSLYYSMWLPRRFEMASKTMSHMFTCSSRPFEPFWRSEQPLKGHGHHFFCTNPHSIVYAWPRRFKIAFKTMSHVFTCKSGLKQAIWATLEVRTASKSSWTSVFLHQSWYHGRSWPRRLTMASKTASHMFPCEFGLKQAILSIFGGQDSL